jgi:hypothetical protein
MRAGVCVVLLMLCIPLHIFAQKELMDHDSTLLSGKIAAIVSAYGAISSVEFGGGVGCKYWFTDDYNIKVILSGKFSQSTNDTLRMQSHAAIEADIYVARKIYIDTHLIPYLGVGVGVGHTEGGIYTSLSEIHWPIYFTASGYFGVEYLFANKFSLSAEQSINLGYSHSFSTHATEWSVGMSTSTLQFSLYF